MIVNFNYLGNSRRRSNCLEILKLFEITSKWCRIIMTAIITETAQQNKKTLSKMEFVCRKLNFSAKSKIYVYQIFMYKKIQRVSQSTASSQHAQQEKFLQKDVEHMYRNRESSSIELCDERTT